MLNDERFSAKNLVVVQRGALTTPVLHPGTFVRLNSGGPAGVVTDLLEDDRVRVTWMTADADHSVLPDRCLTPLAGGRA